MPSPFPGMDPYLESPVHWRGFHAGLIFCINEALNAQLPPGFVSNMDERVYLVQPARVLYPDVVLLQRPAAVPVRPMPGGGGTATLVREKEDAPLLLTVYSDEMREGFIEVRTVGGDEEQVVTVIEVLSPANKAPGSEGRDPYVRKQEQLLRSDVSLLEIDLLRSGAHTIAVPHNTLQAEFGTWDYLVCLHRGGQRWDFEVWRNTVRARLPRVRVPLTNEHPDVLLDLQAAFDHAYDAGPYKRRVDYRKEPDPPLSDEDTAAWADALLREKGVR